MSITREVRIMGKSRQTDGNFILTFSQGPNQIQLVASAEEAKAFQDTVKTVTVMDGKREVRKQVHEDNLDSYFLTLSKTKPPAEVKPPAPVAAVPPKPVAPAAVTPPKPAAPDLFAPKGN